MTDKNLFFNLREKKNSQRTISVEELNKKYNIEDTTFVGFNDHEDEYMNNYTYIQANFINLTKKELVMIAGYYGISKRKKTKETLMEEIITFELDEMNEEIVNRRRILWYYFEEIKNDKYLKKYIILK